MDEIYICEDCFMSTKTTYICSICGKEICFDCAYLATFTTTSKTECANCFETK